MKVVSLAEIFLMYLGLCTVSIRDPSDGGEAHTDESSVRPILFLKPAMAGIW